MAKNEYNVRISYSKSLAAIAIVIVAIVMLFIAFAISSSTPKQMPLIRIGASGTVTAVPNETSIYVYANGTGTTASSALANLSSIAGMLNQTIIPLLNGNVSNIQTLYFNIYVPPQCPNSTSYYRPYYCIPLGGQKFYVAAEDLLFNIPDSGNADSAIVKIAGFNGVSIGSVSAKLSTQQQMELSQQALAQALENATSQAQALAGSGTQISVVNITVNSGYIYPIYGAGSVGVAVSPSPPKNQSFFPGTIEVSRSITVIFGIGK